MTDRLRLGLLEGDGIGAEIVPAAVAVVDAALAAAGAPAAQWVALPVGRAAIDTHGDPIPAETLDALAGMDAWLLGPHDSESYPEPFKTRLSPSGAIRKDFGLFANIRPAKSFEGARAVVPGTDLVIVRENTQGSLAGSPLLYLLVSDVSLYTFESDQIHSRSGVIGAANSSPMGAVTAFVLGSTHTA